MKKCIMALFLAVLVSAGIVFAGERTKNGIPKVSVMSIEPVTVQDTINSSGKISHSNKKVVNSTTSGVVSEIMVAEGDTVSEGQALFSVVKTAVDPSSTIDKNDIPSSDDIIDEVYSAFLSGNYSALENYEDVIESYSNNYTATNKATDTLIKEGEVVTIYAPMEGTVNTLNVTSGDKILAGEELAAILEDNGLQVSIPINESDINNVKIGQKVKITGNGLSKTYSGTVKDIGKEAKAASAGKEATVEVIVVIDDYGDEVKIGFTAKCSIILSENEETLLLPYDVIRAEENGKEYVYTYSNGVASKKYISTGTEYSNGLEVKTGVTRRDYIIEAPDEVKDQESVKIK